MLMSLSHEPAAAPVAVASGQVGGEAKNLRASRAPVVVVLEGGYNVPSIALGLHACTAALLDIVDPSIGVVDKLAAATSPVAWAIADIQATIDAHRVKWHLA